MGGWVQGDRVGKVEGKVEATAALHTPSPPNRPPSHAAPGLPLVMAAVSAAPAVPPPCTHKHPVHAVVELESVTRTLRISPLHKYCAWTFNGTVRVRAARLRARPPPPGVLC